MPKGVKGFIKGHKHSAETKSKIGAANKRNRIIFNCDYCSKKVEEKESHYKKTKRHFCSRRCYYNYVSEIMPKQEQNAYGTGYSPDEKNKRIKARSILNHYLRDKKIERQPCEICGLIKTEAHHDDYDKPLEIRWLCFKHHREWHKKHDNPDLLKETV